MNVLIKLPGPGDDALLTRADAGVFDYELLPDRATEFLRDPRHHLAVAVVSDRIVGMASPVHYVHPDKDPELWINEVGVADAFQRQGIAKRLLAALFDLAKTLGCGEAWVLTDRSNDAAMRLYSSARGEPTDQVMFTFR